MKLILAFLLTTIPMCAGDKCLTCTVKLINVTAYCDDGYVEFYKTSCPSIRQNEYVCKSHGGLMSNTTTTRLAMGSGKRDWVIVIVPDEFKMTDEIKLSHGKIVPAHETLLTTK